MTAVQVRHAIAAEACDVIATEPANATAAEATDVSSAKAADVATTEAAHVPTAKAAAATMPAAAPAARLRTGGDKAAGKYGARQNHHHSSSHDILHFSWTGIPPQVQSDFGALLWERQRRDRLEMAMPVCRPH
jgi:hypothetical protein